MGMYKYRHYMAILRRRVVLQKAPAPVHSSDTHSALPSPKLRTKTPLLCCGALLQCNATLSLHSCSRHAGFQCVQLFIVQVIILIILLHEQRLLLCRQLQGRSSIRSHSCCICWSCRIPKNRAFQECAWSRFLASRPAHIRACNITQNKL